MDLFSVGVYARSDTTASSPEPDDRTFPCNEPAVDIESEYGWKLYFGELGQTANRDVENLDLDYGWRLYFGELEPESKTSDSVGGASHPLETEAADGDGCGDDEDDDVETISLEEPSASGGGVGCTTTTLEEKTQAEEEGSDEVVNVYDTVEEEKEAVIESPSRARADIQRQRIFDRLKQEYLADGLLESEAETLATLQIDSMAPARELLPDVWVKVLHFLPPSLILRFGEVCRSWLTAARDDAVWQLQLSRKSWSVAASIGREQSLFERYWDLRHRRVYAWGNSEHGQTGQGVMKDRDRRSGWEAVEVGGLVGLGVEFVACGAAHSACVTAAGLLYTWGCGAYGRLGHGSCDNTYAPRLVAAFREMRVLSVSGGGAHTMALVQRTDGCEEVFAWGSNQYGQCGAVERARGHTAAERETAAEARRAAAERERATEAPPSEGDDEDAGWRGYGLGCYYTRPMLQSVGTAVSASHPHGADQAPLRAEQASHHGSDQHRSRRRSDHHHQGSDQVCDLRCGGAHSLILLRGGGILALGRGEYGVLGNGELRDALVPTLVRGFGPRTGFGRNCRERADELDREPGSAETQVKRQRGWASSSKGSQGDRRAEEWWEEVEGDVVAVAVAAGAEHSLAVDSKGRVWGWGWNAHGQLGVGVQGSAREGDGGVVARPCRVDVPKARGVAGGHVHSGVISADGSLYTFGKDALPAMAAGRLGHHGYQSPAAVRDDRMPPTRMTALASTHVVCVSCGADHTAALCTRRCSVSGEEESQVFVWGALMEAGEGGFSKYTRPAEIQLDPEAKARQLAAGEDHALALTSRGRAVLAPAIQHHRKKAWT